MFASREPVDKELNRLNPDSSARVRDSNAAAFTVALEPVRSALPALSVVTHLDSDTPPARVLRRARGKALAVVGIRGPGFVRRVLLGPVSHSGLVALETQRLQNSETPRLRRSSWAAPLTYGARPVLPPRCGRR